MASKKNLQTKKSASAPIASAAPVAKKPAASSACSPKSCACGCSPTPAASPANSKEANLKKLAESSLVISFVKSKDGAWNHQDWLEFLADIKAKGYDPVEPEQVGLLLEEKKAVYLASKNA